MPGQLEAGLQRVQAKLRTARLRTDFHSDSSVLVDDDADSEEEEGRGGRVLAGEDARAVGLPHESGWTRQMPGTGQQMVGKQVASLHFSPSGEPAWYEAIVVEHVQRVYNRGASDMYRLYFEEDKYDDWYSLPDDTVIYRPSARVSKSKLQAALAACRG